MEPTPENVQPSEVPKPTPVMDVRPPAPEPLPVTAPAPEGQAGPSHAEKPQLVHQPPKRQGVGVGLAIAATVIIVLGLATLATYAYLQSAN